MKVAVVGGSGWIGLRTIRRLLEAGHEVVNIDRRWPQDQGAAAEFPTHLVELKEPFGIHRALEGCEGICHLAAQPFSRVPIEADTFANNALATFHVYQAAYDLQIPRVVYISSVQATGLFGQLTSFPPLYLPIDEHYPSHPRQTYALTKRLGEQLADMFVHAAGGRLSIVTLRFAFVMQRWPNARRWVERALADPQRYAREFWTITGVDDAAEACLRALTVELEGHRICHVHSREPLANATWRELRERFYPQVEWRGSDENEPLVSLAACRQVLGFEPATTWRDYVDIDQDESDQPGPRG